MKKHIDMYFNIKNYLKNTHNHTTHNHTINHVISCVSLFSNFLKYMTHSKDYVLGVTDTVLPYIDKKRLPV
jgi:hypothetical protein